MIVARYRVICTYIWEKDLEAGSMEPGREKPIWESLQEELAIVCAQPD